MVSNASDDLPLPLKPVTTTSLSRGIESVRFLRLCSRAPPILMNSLLTIANFPNQTIGKHILKPAGKQRWIVLEQFQKTRPATKNLCFALWRRLHEPVEAHCAQWRGLRAVVRERGHAVAGGRGGIGDRVPNLRREIRRPLHLDWRTG